MSKTRFLKIKLFLFTLLLLNAGAYAQVKTITGVVKDDAGKPLSSATVTAKGSNKGVTTKDDGSFSISIPESAKSLTISFEGFESNDVDVQGKDNVSVIMKQSIVKLQDVVVQTGYGTQKAKDVTGAITQVKGEAVKNLATQDVATLLQGRVAGVEVVTPSGQPGASSQITIRGVSSLNGSQPLYVIDGVQQPNGNNVNPQDIESMSVLKDASAAAIYGASAAGGVIIITTKRGKGTKPTISFSTKYGVSKPKTVQLLDKTNWIQYNKDINNQYYTSAAYTSQVASLVPVDWNNEIYRNGAEQNYSLSVSGSSPNVDYFLSGVYNNQQGVFLDNKSSMAGARVNTDIKLSNAIKIGEQLNVYNRFTIPVKTPIVSTPFESQPVYTGPIYSSVPGTTLGIYPFGYTNGFNVVQQIKNATFEFPQNSFQGQVYLEAKLPVKYMTFKATFGYTSQTYQNNLFLNKYTANNTVLTLPDGTVENNLYRNIGNYEQTLNAYILAYDHTWGKHTINLLVGYEQYANTTQNLQTNVQNVLPSSSFAYIPSSSSLAAGGQSVSGNYDDQGLVKSQFGRINYDYNKHFYATFTVRRDGNFTIFNQNQQHGIFPAVSTGWNINEEHFFKKYRNVVNQLKLRGSYGELGNSAIPPYSYATRYNQTMVQNFAPGGNAQVGFTQQAIPNPGIQWENTKEGNIGLDGQMLGGKIYFTIDWYNKNTTHLLYDEPVSLSSGVPSSGNGFLGGAVNAGTYLENIGSVRNTGLDIAVGYNGKVKDINYSAGVTGSFNTNTVLSIVGGDGLPDGNNNYPYGTSIWKGQALTRTYAGAPFGQFWGLKALGIYKENDPLLATAPMFINHKPTAGDLIYQDVDHNGRINDSDNQVIGNPYPKFTFGINLTANWKGFDIAMLFNGALGVQLYNGVTPYEFESLDGSNVTSKVFQASGFPNNGTNNGVTNYPTVGYTDGGPQDPNGNYTNPSSYFIENGNYLKLKNLQIGYTFSNKLLEKVKIKSLRIYVMANNVFTITKYTGVDPELGSQYAILGLDKNGNVTGSPDGTNTAQGGSATTSRGIDGPSKYPNVKLYAAGLDITL